MLLTGLLKVKKKEKLSFCLVLSEEQFTLLSPALSLVFHHCHFRKQTKLFYVAKKKKKKKKRKCIVKQQYDNIQRILPPVVRTGSIMNSGLRTQILRWLKMEMEKRADTFFLLLIPLPFIHFALFHFDLSIHGLHVRGEATGRWLCANVLRSMKYLPKQ